MDNTEFKGNIGMDFDQDVFVNDIRVTFANHYKKNAFFQLACKKEGITPDDIGGLEDLARLPFISTDMFKKSKGHFPKLLLVHVSDIAAWTLSSSTSGDPSIIGRSTQDIKAYVASHKLMASKYAPYSADESYMFLPHPLVLDRTTPGEIFGKPCFPYIARTIESWGLTRDDDKYKHYMLQPNPATNGIDLNIRPLVDRLTSGETENIILIAGSVPLLFPSLLSIKNSIAHPLNFGDRLFIQVAAGGWDGKKGSINIGTTIVKKDFIQLLMELFGIPLGNITDGYGSSETSFICGGAYDPGVEDFIYTSPGWGRIIVRDPKTYEPVYGAGKQGMPQFITPYGVESFIGMSLLMNDLVEIVDYAPEKDGGTGLRFRVVGRLSTAKTVGCGASIARMVEE